MGKEASAGDLDGEQRATGSFTASGAELDGRELPWKQNLQPPRQLPMSQETALPGFMPLCTQVCCIRYV